MIPSITAGSSGAAPWLCDPMYDGMSPKAREASWRAAQERRERLEREAYDREQAEEMVRRWEQDDQRNGNSSASRKPGAPRFIPVAIDDVQLSAEPIWLIDGLLPARGLACVVGPPKSGKSFLTTDMLCAVARAAPYAGRETVGGPVIYLTGEGIQGFQRRVIAMRQHLGIEGQGVPFFHIEHVPDLGSEKTDLPQLIADLDQFIKANCPGRICAIALDTLARCMGEADENSARDMGRFVNRCADIERHFGCVVIVVHHVGKDPNRGGRGSNALNGAADVTMLVEKETAFSKVRIDEMKDGREGQEWTFRLVPYDLKAQLFDATPSRRGG